MNQLADLYLTERVRRRTLDPMTARNYRSSLTGLAGGYTGRPAESGHRRRRIVARGSGRPVGVDPAG